MDINLVINKRVGELNNVDTAQNFEKTFFGGTLFYTEKLNFSQESEQNST